MCPAPRSQHGPRGGDASHRTRGAQNASRSRANRRRRMLSLLSTSLAIAVALAVITAGAIAATPPALVAASAFALLAGVVAGVRGCLERDHYRDR